jgi:hypothetical protein
MPCGNDFSGIMTFTTMVPPMDQIISWIGFHLPVYGSLACARELIKITFFLTQRVKTHQFPLKKPQTFYSQQQNRRKERTDKQGAYNPPS